MFLSSTTDKLQMTTSSAADTTYQTHYGIGNVSTGVLVITGADNKVGVVTSATDTDISGSPAANERWSINAVEICNIHATTAQTVTLTLIKAAGTARQAIKVTLAAGEKLTYSSNGVWFVYDATGAVKMGAIAASDTVAGLIQVALQSDQETGTSVILAVTPGRQQYHPSACKCWLKAGLTGNILVSYNITSLTDTGTGALTITIATDFSSANWSCVATIELASTTLAQSCTYDSMAAGSVLLRSVVEAGSAADPVTWSFAGFGDQ